MTHIPPRKPPFPRTQRDVKPETGLRITNVPKASEPGKRVIGFVMDEDEIETMGLFDKELIEMCVLYLNTQGFIVEKDS